MLMDSPGTALFADAEDAFRRREISANGATYPAHAKYFPQLAISGLAGHVCKGVEVF
jgi:hypothetical protein